MTDQQRRVKALLMKVELVYDEATKNGTDFDEANEYGVLYEIVAFLQENAAAEQSKRNYSGRNDNSTGQVRGKTSLKLVE